MTASSAATPSPVRGRDRDDVGELVALLEPRHPRQERRLGHQVDLVEGQDDRLLDALEQAEDELGPLPRRFGRVDDDHDHVQAAQRVERGVDHADVEAVQRAVDARRVDEDHLRLRRRLDAEDPGPRRLRLVRDDGDLGLDEGVQQRRLAGVGPADERDVAALHDSAAVTRPPRPCGAGGPCGRGGARLRALRPRRRRCRPSRPAPAPGRGA